jgi:hypothetical protein
MYQQLCERVLKFDADAQTGATDVGCWGNVDMRVSQSPCLKQHAGRMRAERLLSRSGSTLCTERSIGNKSDHLRRVPPLWCEVCDATERVGYGAGARACVATATHGDAAAEGSRRWPS